MAPPMTPAHHTRPELTMERELRRDAQVTFRMDPVRRAKLASIATALGYDTETDFFLAMIDGALPKWEQEVESRKDLRVIAEPTRTAMREAAKDLAADMSGKHKTVSVNLGDLYSARGRVLHLILSAVWDDPNSGVDAATRKKVVALWVDGTTHPESAKPR